ncbi:phosphatase PAP2 family protein [Antrihabitans cavernicola]|uniref:Phosphatase PAP2 family protein n=1 Tax=Antrihabitans cavernicola TaxID=2495913 RepID=A0A5A7SEA4_9NOCA|nr:phosphatase PAP2 family protein [Spelaeibacter cavernicola]KAA0022551.1 phosphatase PAP2 family protein [Spelaeibacter cavernicola]
MRRRYIAIAIVGVAVTIALPLTFPSGGGANTFDSWVADRIASILGNHHTTLSVLAEPSTPLVVVPALIVAAIYAATRLRRVDVIAVIAGPLLAVALNSLVFKPLFDRHLDGYLAYPSGHTVSLVAAETAIALLMRSAIHEAVVAAVGTVLLICAAIGMIGLGYHHVTDIIGGTGVGIAVPVIVSVLLDASKSAAERREPQRLRPQRLR